MKLEKSSQNLFKKIIIFWADKIRDIQVEKVVETCADKIGEIYKDRKRNPCRQSCRNTHMQKKKSMQSKAEKDRQQRREWTIICQPVSCFILLLVIIIIIIIIITIIMIRRRYKFSKYADFKSFHFLSCIFIFSMVLYTQSVFDSILMSVIFSSIP